jgi:hypothetical protein
MKTFMLIAALAAGGGTALATTTFYTIGPDNQFVPSAFTSILLPGGPVTNLFDLGGGVKGFNGGITYDPLNNSFYGIGNDDQGNSSLQIFTAGGNGTILTVESLGTGFTSGLTFDSTDGNLYAISNDFQVTGHSFLNRISLSDMSVIPIVDLGLGFEGGGLFTGGLTYNPNNGLFYVLSADANGVSRQFNSITLSGASGTATFLFSLGIGADSYNGGLVFNPADNRFYAISNDSSANSTLKSFALGGGTITSELALGQGFNNVGLTLVQSASVPEPSSGLLLGGALLLRLGMRLWRSTGGEAGTGRETREKPYNQEFRSRA